MTPEKNDSIITIKCNEHDTIQKALYRIEGENIAIISLISVILTLVVAKII